MLADGAVGGMRVLRVSRPELLDMRVLPHDRSLGARVVPRDPRLQHELHEERDGAGESMEER